VGKATDGRKLVSMAQEIEPDVIVADMTMPELNGLDAARQILATLPDTRIVLLTVHEDAMLAAEALRSGVSGFLVKRSAAGELQRALREALAGRTYLTPLVADGDSELLLLETGDPSPIDRLTPREREVLQLLAEGYSMKEVGSRLGITARTVAFHKYQMSKKLDVRSTAELVRFAVDHRLA
ncbi:MAG: response regulator transcription factor, partial [Acidobacteriota bacterium]